MDKQFKRATQLKRSEVFKPKVKIKGKKNFHLVVKHNTRLPNISAIVKKHIHLLEPNQLVKDIFPAKSIIPAYRRTKTEIISVLS